MKTPLLTGLLLATLLTGCAGPRFKADPDMPQFPKDAVGNIDQLVGKTVVWGGVIANTENLADSTRLEIVAYPLNMEQKPQAGYAATGRFMVEKAGYLEAADYAPTRRITVLGVISGSESGKVGEASYEYPVLKATELELWPQEPPAGYVNTGVRFGIGINIHN